jgi:hypothetical protein
MHQRVGHNGHVAIATACLFGLICAALGGIAGVPVAAWCGLTLALAGRASGPRLGVLALGLAALYGLAALSSFAGNDPEDVAPTVNLRLAVIALGCVIVGVTSVAVRIASRERGSMHDAQQR